MIREFWNETKKYPEIRRFLITEGVLGSILVILILLMGTFLVIGNMLLADILVCAVVFITLLLCLVLIFFNMKTARRDARQKEEDK